MAETGPMTRMLNAENRVAELEAAIRAHQHLRLAPDKRIDERLRLAIVQRDDTLYRVLND